MAALNKVILIGRLTRDVVTRSFNNGGKVASFGFAVTNRKKNQTTGQWEDDPMFIDCDAFNRGENGKLADIIAQYCRKGSQICIEGHLILDKWDDKSTGEKRQKHKIVVDNMQLLDPKSSTDGGEGYPSTTTSSRSNGPVRSGSGFSKNHMDDSDEPAGAGSGGGEEEVPF